MNKTIKRNKVINYYDNKGNTIIGGFDTIVYAIKKDDYTIKKLKDWSKSHPINSNMRYLDPTEEFEAFWTHDVTRYGHIFNYTLANDQFTFSGFQLFYNDDIIKRTIYGSTFRICEILGQDIHKLSEHYLLDRGFSTTHIIRADYKYDIFNVKPGEAYKLLKKRNPGNVENRVIEIIKRNHEAETIYIGDRKNNKYIFARIYNKYIDSKKKLKSHLYFDYPNPTTRFEFQMGKAFIGDLQLSSIENKVHEYLGFKPKTGSYCLANRYDPNVIIDIEKYCTQRENRTVKLIKSGYDLRPTVKRINTRQENYTFRISKKSTNIEYQKSKGKPDHS